MASNGSVLNVWCGLGFYEGLFWVDLWWCHRGYGSRSACSLPRRQPGRLRSPFLEVGGFLCWSEWFQIHQTGGAQVPEEHGEVTALTNQRAEHPLHLLCGFCVFFTGISCFVVFVGASFPGTDFSGISLKVSMYLCVFGLFLLFFFFMCVD